MKLLIILSFILSFNSCINLDKDKKEIAIKIKMEVLEKELSKKFPIKQNVKIGTLEISNPNFIGKNKQKDKLDLQLYFNFSNFLVPKGISGEIKISTGVYYNSKDYHLYLKDSMIEEFRISDFTLSKFLTSSVKNIILDIALREIVKYPIYNLKKHDKLTFALRLLKNITIKDSHLLLSFGL